MLPIVNSQSLYYLLDIIKTPNDYMDRLFGKELSNLHPLPLNNHKVSSKSTRDTDLPIKEEQKKHEARPTSVNHENKKYTSKSSVGREQVPEKETNKNIQMLPEYFDECLAFMLNQESKSYAITNYLRNHSAINAKMRGILLDWIAELHYKYRMFPETLYATIMMLDIYLSKKTVKKENLQLVGVAAFFTAAKYEETYQVPQLDDLVHFSAKAFTKQDIIKMEADLIQVLEFNLIMTTSYRFFQALAKITDMESKNFYLAQYALQLSLLDTKFLEYKPSLVASSAIYLINKIRKKSDCWPDRLQVVTKYQQKDLKMCARQLCYLLQRSDELAHTKSLRRKFSSCQYQEVTKIKLEKRKP